jgi:hypothetical protein
VLYRGMRDGGEREIKRQVKARQARLAKYNAQSTPALQLQEGGMGCCSKQLRRQSSSFVLSGQRKNNCEAVATEYN